MIIDLQIKETKLVSGARFLPGLTSRLNDWVGKPLESLGKAIKKPFSDLHGSVHHDKNGWSYDGGGKIANVAEPDTTVYPTEYARRMHNPHMIAENVWR